MNCWATFRTKKAAWATAWECPGELVPHGHKLDRRHYVYLQWYRGANADKALCAEESCWTCSHGCRCDVCTGEIPLIEVPGRNAVVQTLSSGPRYALRPYQLERGYAK